jgi:hypothetical protein
MWEAEIEQTQKHACVAYGVIAQLTEQLTLYNFDNCDERMLVALPLLKSSFDMAAATTKLLSLDPVEYGGAAEAMFRPQLERYMRAVLFGSAALTSDVEVHEFFESDKMPKRSGRGGAPKRDISFAQLTQDVASEIVRQTGRDDQTVADKFAALLTHDRNIHGAVHGGQIVLRRYLTPGGLAHNPSTMAGGEHITCTVALGVLALSQAAHLHGIRNNSNEFRITNRFRIALEGILSGMPKPLPESRY